MLSSCLPVWFWGKYHHHSPGVRQSFECIHPGHRLPLSQLWPPARIITVAEPQVSHIWPFPTCPDASESQWPGPLTLRFTSLVLRSHCSSSQRAYQTAPYLPVPATHRHHTSFTGQYWLNSKLLRPLSACASAAAPPFERPHQTHFCASWPSETAPYLPVPAAHRLPTSFTGQYWLNSKLCGHCPTVQGCTAQHATVREE